MEGMQQAAETKGPETVQLAEAVEVPTLAAPPQRSNKPSHHMDGMLKADGNDHMGGMLKADGDEAQHIEGMLKVDGRGR